MVVWRCVRPQNSCAQENWAEPGHGYKPCLLRGQRWERAMRIIISALVGVFLAPLLVVLFIAFLAKTDSLWVAAAGTFIILAALARMALGMITRWMARREQKRAWKTLAATALVAEALELEKKKMANEADDWDAFDDDVLDDASFAADDGIGWNDEDDDPFLEDDDPLFSDDWRVKEER